MRQDYDGAGWINAAQPGNHVFQARRFLDIDFKSNSLHLLDEVIADLRRGR